ncbi:MAG: efflux RND transporter periplasmic adaptor subunit [Thermoguttaceae bacterium]|jgi:multidrug efflux pump subunit AcrA (membrane-fusion protein)
MTRSRKWVRPVVVFAVVGLLAVAGYLLATNRQVREALVAKVLTGNGASQPAAHSHGEASVEAAHGDHGHGHGGDEPTVKTTLWADKVDIFLERPYAVAGKAIEPLFHVTVMRNGNPVTEGSLVFKAIGPEQNTVEIRSEKPTRPGIFIPSVTFPKAGTYQVKITVESPQVEGGSETIELPPVVVYGSQDETLAAAKAAPEDNEADTISFLKEQQWRVGLITAPAENRELVERLVVPGRVIVPSGAGAIVSSPVTGKAVPPEGEGFPRVGDKVKQGQVLALVEPSVAGAEAVQLVTNQAQLQTLDADLAVKQLEIETKARTAGLALTRAKDTLERRRKLAADGITAGKELLTAEHEVRLAQAELDGLRQVVKPYVDARERLARVLGKMKASGDVGDQRDDMRVTLRSPISGTIVEASVTSGELVSNTRKLFHVVNLDTLWIEANVSEYDLARVQQAPGASYRLAAYPDRIVPILRGGGRLVDVGAIVDPDTRTVPIRYELPNTDGMLRVGMFADLLVETNRKQTALAVPKDAVVDEGGEIVVYLQRGGETFERRRVEVGIRDADQLEIRNGLAAGDRVATKGAYTIRLSTMSSAIPAHGHAH